MKKKVIYVVSDIDKALAFEWIAMGLRNSIDLQFILITKENSILELFLSESGIKYYWIKRNQPLIKIWISLFKLFLNLKPDIIHAHLEKASLLGLSSGYFSRIKKRIYTRHHATLNFVYSKKGILIDQLNNFFATDIIAPSNNIKDLLIKKEQVSSNKVHLIHHGFDLEGFKNPNQSDVKALMQKYNPKKQRPVIGVIARWDELKGIQYIIPAFKKLLLKYPEALLILANAKGPYSIKERLAILPKENYYIIQFETDIFSLYQLFDIYIHVPIESRIEGFGQTYVEALAAGIPSIFTMSGVAPEFIEHEKNALVVPFKDSEAIYFSIDLLLGSEYLRSELIKKSKESINPFQLKYMNNRLEELYGD